MYLFWGVLQKKERLYAPKPGCYSSPYVLYLHISVCVYIYVYRERERERDRVIPKKMKM